MAGENERLARIETTLDSLKELTQTVATAVTTLTRVEQDNAYVKQSLADQARTTAEHGRDIAAIKAELPTLSLARTVMGWIGKAVGAAVLVAVLASIGLHK